MELFEEPAELYVTSYLRQDAIRWINRKQKNESNSVKAYLFPPITVQIYELLGKIIDTDFPGNRKIAELFEVVKYVVELFNLENSKYSGKKYDESSEYDLLNGYVGSDRSGGAEYAEYLALNYDRGRVKTIGPDDDELTHLVGPVDELTMLKTRLLAAVNELCTHLRRKKIDQKIADATSGDVEKYNAMVELFGINYFKSNGLEKKITQQNIERSKKFPNLPLQKSGMRNYKLENSVALRKQRKKELDNIRNAQLFLGAQESALHPKEQEKLLKFWEQKGELIPLRKSFSKK